MSESRAILRREFQDREYREAYAHDFLNTYIATQLKAIREQRVLKQSQLADLIGTKQAGISRLENVNYSAWSVSTLEKIAFALGARLRVSVETFGSLLDEDEAFCREFLQRPTFEEDPAFQEPEGVPSFLPSRTSGHTLGVMLPVTPSVTASAQAKATVGQPTEAFSVALHSP